MTKPSPNYSPFGSLIPNRSLSDASREYRFGFNTQEKDNEVAGKGNSYTAEFWQYDGRLGRRFNIDPVFIPSLSNYSTFNNNPIFYIDIKGNVFDPSSQNRIDQHKKDIKFKIEVLNIYKKQLLKLMNDQSDNSELWKGIEQADKAIKELTAQLNEIKVLEESTQVYRISTSSKNNGLILNSDGSITISLKEDNKGLLAHELKHAYQFENQEYSFYTFESEGGVRYVTGILYDIYDEVEAYKAAWAIEYYEVNSDLYEDITPANILKLGAKNGLEYDKAFLNTSSNVTTSTLLTKEILRWYYGDNMPKRKVYKKYLGKPISLYINEVLLKYEITNKKK